MTARLGEGDIVDDITPATRRMTYAELGEARGISPKSAERLAQRRRWPRQVGNDGMARVVVPIGEDRVTPRRQGLTSSPDIATRRGVTSTPYIGDVIGAAIHDLVAPLSAQLEHERTRADRAERRADEERTVAEKLRAELIDLRVSERIADRAVAEVVELRQRLDEAATAERIVRDEAAGLRAELDARRTWGLRRRLRWALGRRR